MNLQNRKKHLSKIDIFQTFSPKQLSKLAENVDEVQLEVGESIFEEGDSGRDMYILLEGSVKIYKNKRFITRLEAVDYLGEMAIIDNKPRSATATAITPVYLYKISALIFKKYLAKDTASLFSLIETLSKRIRQDTNLLAEEFQKANTLIHDMRNRFSVFLLLNLLEQENLSEDGLKYIQLMKDSYRDLSIMMDEAMANAKRLKFTQLKENSSINYLLENLQHTEFILHESLKDKNIILDLDPGLTDFPFNIIAIRRVITNLTINANQASSIHSNIEITTKKQNNYCIISIKDYGCGIPESIQHKIFDPHFSTKHDGNGLGLASCKEIIEAQHHGYLSFKTSSKGTTFSLTLPMTTTNENAE